jgi:hypothetical protein
MTLLWTNNASSTIAGSITATATTVNLAPGTGILFPQPLNVGDLFKATFYDQQTKTINEIVHVTARSGDQCTIVRGQENTTPVAWSAGDIFANLITADTLRHFIQSTGPAADTSIVYVGIDTSTNVNLIIANTTPVPASFQIGMLFNIKMLNAKFPPVISSGPPPVTGDVMMQLNGQAGVAVKRTDGSAFIGGETTGGEEYIFIYNGSHFTSTVMHVKPQPPQTVFYVNGTYGNDWNSGFSDNGGPTTQAFKTCQGAINRIKERYTSTVAITVRVADGIYDTGFSDSDNYIAGWTFIGNPANPQNVVIDSTSTSLAHFQSNGSPAGISVAVGPFAYFVVQGFTFKSQYPNVQSSGTLTLIDCHFTPPLYRPANIHTIIADAGTISITGNCSYDGTLGASAGIFDAGAAGVMGIGSSGDPVYGQTTTCTFYLNGNPSFALPAGGFGALVTAETNSLIQFSQSYVTFTGGVCDGYEYIATAGGGIYFDQGAVDGWLPATMPGYTEIYGWAI